MTERSLFILGHKEHIFYIFPFGRYYFLENIMSLEKDGRIHRITNSRIVGFESFTAVIRSGTMLQAGRSWVRFSMGSLDFSILPAAI
jgi:hypothetical protein